MAETLDWITARGDRSSCEADAMNSVCFFPAGFQRSDHFLVKARRIQQVQGQRSVLQQRRPVSVAKTAAPVWKEDTGW